VVLQAAAPTLGQHAAVNGTTTYDISPTMLTDGSTLVVGIGQPGGDADQAYSLSDGVNTWSSAVLSANTSGATPSRHCQIFYAPNIVTTAGALTITVTVSNGNGASRAQWVEVLGAHLTAPLNQTDSVAESGNNTTHAAAVSMTTASDVFVYTIMVGNSALGTFTPTTTTTPDFITLAGDFSVGDTVSQYYSGATALSADTITWSSATGRTVANCAASFIAPAAGGRAPSLSTLMARGR